MKGFKKFFVMAILAVMVAVCSLGVFGVAFADEVVGKGEVSVVKTTRVYAQEMTADVGNSLEVGIFVESEQSIAGFNIEIFLPNFVTYEECAVSKVFEEIDATYTIDVQENCVKVICNSDNTNAMPIMELFTISVRIDSEGESNVSVCVYGLTDVDGNAINYYSQDGYINASSNIIKGDVDGDGSVTLSDLMYMQQYVIGSFDYSFDFKYEKADINADGNIDLYDCQHVQRYLVDLITFDELQSLSGNNGGSEGETPEIPDVMGMLTYSVVVDGKVLEDAFTVDSRTFEASFVYNGVGYTGTAIPASFVSEDAIEGLVAFISNKSTKVYLFELLTEDKIELVDEYDLAKEENPQFAYDGEYNLINPETNLSLGGITIENGVFYGNAMFKNNRYEFYLNINGYIEAIEGKPNGFIMYLFGEEEFYCEMEDNNIFVQFQKDTDAPANPDAQRGTTIEFIDSQSGDVISIVIKQELATFENYEMGLKYLMEMAPAGYSIQNYTVRSGEGSVYYIVYVNHNGAQQQSGIEFKIIMSDEKSEMINPMGNMPISSIEQMKAMIVQFQNMGEENPLEVEMNYVGIYFDRQGKMAYDVDVDGIEGIKILYVKYNIKSIVGATAEYAGTYTSYTYDEQGSKIMGTDTLTIDGTKDTFTLVRTINGQKVTLTGSAIALGGSVSSSGPNEGGENGYHSYTQMCLITAEKIQLMAVVEAEYKNGQCIFAGFMIATEDDYGSYEEKEELEDFVGVYTALMYDGEEYEGKFRVTLNNNGTAKIEMLYMEMYSSYSVDVTFDGKETISMYMMGELLSGGIIDKEAGTITFDMSLMYDEPSTNRPNYSENGDQNIGSTESGDELVSDKVYMN